MMPRPSKSDCDKCLYQTDPGEGVKPGINCDQEDARTMPDGSCSCFEPRAEFEAGILTDEVLALRTYLTADGHTPHCIDRIAFGDGECECNAGKCVTCAYSDQCNHVVLQKIQPDKPWIDTMTTRMPITGCGLWKRRER